ncbi:MAG: glycosyltransferase family 2 protein [Rhodospirillales bacterium]|nr:glycosyltransferase family 2 protein [Rhodospirillales bacterium]
MTQKSRSCKGVVATCVCRHSPAARRMGAAVSKIGCVAVVKNEARHIAEWLAWQFVLGFDTVFLLDNGSTDATAAIAGGFAPQYDVRVIDYPNNARDYQMRGYEMLARQVADEYEWLAFFDADEFLRLDDDLTLKALLAARPEAAIAVPWAIFGSSGHQDIPPGLLVENFTRRSHWDFPPNAHVKSIIRPALMDAALNPHVFQVRGDYVDLLGRPVVWSSSGVRARPSDCAGGALNHYFVRSAAHWAEKLKRVYNDLTRKAEEFKDYDRNEVEDKRLAGQAGQIREILSRISPPMHEFAICACARWETRYITEWLSYYREIGFSHIYLYCNDDDPGEMYQQVLPFLQGEAPFVTFHHHPHQGQQFEMYAHFVRNHLAETEWASFFDIDEFLRLPPGETIGDFIQRFPPDVESVLFNWFNFGPNGHKAPPEGPVLENFTRREEKIHPFTKFVTRSASMAGILAVPQPRVHGFWHTVSDKFDHPVKTVNVLGEDMAEYYTSFPDRAVETLADPAYRERLFAVAGIHHYGFRSERAYAERAARGLGGDFGGQISWKKIAEGPNFAGLLAAMNAVEDTSLANFWAARRQRARGHSTSAPPRGKTHVPARRPVPGPVRGSRWKYRFVIATCARWETPYAAEWLAYHQALGFEHVYLYCNDDDPAELYEAILPFTQGPAPFVTFRHFPEQGMQRKMLLHFCAQNGQDSEWVSFLDLDEFLRLPSGQTLPDYMQGFEGKTDCLMFNWVYCGPNGHATQPKSVLKNLTRRQASVHPFTKMVFRSWILGQPELFKNAPDCSFLHRLHQYVTVDIRPMNTLGEDMLGYYNDTHFAELADGWARGRKPLNRIFESGAFIHHYAFRTEAAFTERVARGLGGDFHGQDHWGRVAENETLRAGFTASINAVEDMTLAEAWERMIASSRRLAVEPVPDPSSGQTPLPSRPDNISFGKSALQSSHCQWSFAPTAAQDAARAVNGIIDGTRKFHTDIEDNPWWQVDLGGIATITEIHIHNTRDFTWNRLTAFSIGASIDGESWVTLAEHHDEPPREAPFIWSGPGTAWARFVRVTLLGRNFLHLDQVEVFGRL